MKCLIAFLQSLPLLAAPSGATDHFVEENGRDSDPGTKDLPFRTIQKAAEVMQAGDTCSIRAGTQFPRVPDRFQA